MSYIYIINNKTMANLPSNWHTLSDDEKYILTLQTTIKELENKQTHWAPARLQDTKQKLREFLLLLEEEANGINNPI